MATFLDVTGLEHFTNIFVFLFVWVVVYAMLLWTKILGDNKFASAVIGLFIGIFVLLSSTATNIISGTAPFLAVVFVLTFLLNIASRMLGADVEAFPAIKGLLIVFIVFIILVGVALEFQDSNSAEPKNGETISKSSSILLNPKFLGAILIFSISIFTIALLASKSA